MCKSKGSKLVRYSDSSYGNATKQQSISGYIFMASGGPMSWSSRKQLITVALTTEAEYVAAANATKQTVWI